jgi:hypothetical protein
VLTCPVVAVVIPVPVVVVVVPVARRHVGMAGLRVARGVGIPVVARIAVVRRCRPSWRSPRPLPHNAKADRGRITSMACLTRRCCGNRERTGQCHRRGVFCYRFHVASFQMPALTPERQPWNTHRGFAGTAAEQP